MKTIKDLRDKKNATHFDAGYYVALTDFIKLIDKLNNKRYCPYCGKVMKQNHLCDSCNERVSCPEDVPEAFIEELVQQIKGEPRYIKDGN